MPQNTDFSIQVLVGGSPIPEYEKDGRYYVESNLATPFSYRQESNDIVQGEVESQMWPVTPYTLCLCARTKSSEPCYYRIIVDGVKVKGLSIAGGQARIIKGFRDGACIREFLFSMPRFARDQSDRIDDARKESVGCIEIQCWNATLRKTKFGLKRNYLEFEQANKKDSTSVTNGEYTMATSKAGKVVCSRSLYRSVDNWKLTTLRSSIKINYHMGHTLQSMGFTLRPFEFREEALKKHSVVRLKRPQRTCISEPNGGSSGERSSGKSSDQDSSQDATDVTVTKDGPDTSKRKRKPSPALIDLTSDGEEEDSSADKKKTKVAKTEIKTEKETPEKKMKEKKSEERSGDIAQEKSGDKGTDKVNTEKEAGEGSKTGKDSEANDKDTSDKDDKNDEGDKDGEAEPCLAAEPLPMSEEIASLLQTLGVKVPGSENPEDETSKAPEDGAASKSDANSDEAGTENQGDEATTKSASEQAAGTEEEEKKKRTNSSEADPMETEESSAEKEVLDGVLDKIEMSTDNMTTQDEEKGKESTVENTEKGSVEPSKDEKITGTASASEVASEATSLAPADPVVEDDHAAVDDTESAIAKDSNDEKGGMLEEPMDTQEKDAEEKTEAALTKEADKTGDGNDNIDGESSTANPELVESQNSTNIEDPAQDVNSIEKEENVKEKVQEKENIEAVLDGDTLKETSSDKDTEKETPIENVAETEALSGKDTKEQTPLGQDNEEDKNTEEESLLDQDSKEQTQLDKDTQEQTDSKEQTQLDKDTQEQTQSDKDTEEGTLSSKDVENKVGDERDICEKEKDNRINNDELSDAHKQNIPEESREAEKGMVPENTEDAAERLESDVVTEAENAMLDENQESNISKEWETALDDV